MFPWKSSGAFILFPELEEISFLFLKGTDSFGPKATERLCWVCSDFPSPSPCSRALSWLGSHSQIIVGIQYTPSFTPMSRLGFNSSPCSYLPSWGFPEVQKSGTLAQSRVFTPQTAGDWGLLHTLHSSDPAQHKTSWFSLSLFFPFPFSERSLQRQTRRKHFCLQERTKITTPST